MTQPAGTVYDDAAKPPMGEVIDGWTPAGRFAQLYGKTHTVVYPLIRSLKLATEKRAGFSPHKTQAIYCIRVEDAQRLADRLNGKGGRARPGPKPAESGEPARRGGFEEAARRFAKLCDSSGVTEFVYVDGKIRYVSVIGVKP